MKKYAIFLLVTFLLMSIVSVTGMKVIYDYRQLVGQATRLINDTHYDRNPSFFEDVNGTYWLFFVRSVVGDANYDATCLGKGCDESGCNCDGASYDLYYMNSMDDGNTWSAETKVSECSTGQRGMAAFQDNDGKIWVFMGGFGGADKNIRYCTYSGGIWSGPTLVPGPVTANHLDALQDNSGNIWVFYESGADATGDAIYTSNGGTTWSTKIDVTPGYAGVPKAMQDADGNMSVVFTDSTGIYRTKSPTGMTGTWSTPSLIADSGPSPIFEYDPVLYQDSDGKYWLFFAPWDSGGGTNSQWLESAYSSDGNVWSLPVRLTYGGVGATVWWDMWPEAFQTSLGNMLIFYTSEMSQGSVYKRGDGNIWMFRADISVEKRVSELENKVNVDHEVRILTLETWRRAIDQTISNILQRLEAVESFLQNLGQQPAPSCPNGICETWFGENSTSCPQDCPGGVVDNEIFITENWRVECPAMFNSRNITECRAEILRDGSKMTEETLQVRKTRKVNPYMGYSIKLYGKI